MWRYPTRSEQLATPVSCCFSRRKCYDLADLIVHDRKELIHVEGTMFGEKNLKNIVYPYVRLWRLAVAEPFVFMDDN